MSSIINNKPCRILSFFILIFINACTITHTPVGLDGAIKIFSDSPQNPIFGKDSDWARLGDAHDINIKSVYKGAIPVLQISSGYSNIAFLRRTNAQLLATPFLFWSWVILDGPPVHPVSLVIGFTDTKEEQNQNKIVRGIFNKQSLPSFSRTITLVWGERALKRGTLIMEKTNNASKPDVRYIVRGGHENHLKWWNESIDLSQIHTSAWPTVDISKSRVVFIGIIAVSGPVPGTMQIAQVKLSR
tara:strand:+ start:207 stop:938 length:732 start_codon:yes stop_codon:yes gene_type:complete